MTPACFVAMEYVRGRDLRSIIRGAVSAGGRFGPEHVVAIGMQVSDALACAHGRRDDSGRPRPIVHRDVSPSNVIVRPDGRVKLLDFGAARDETGPPITTTSALVGKLPYMSPEQIELQALDGRTDMFSLGVVLWELLALRRPFPNDHVSLLRMIPTTDVPTDPHDPARRSRRARRDPGADAQAESRRAVPGFDSGEPGALAGGGKRFTRAPTRRCWPSSWPASSRPNPRSSRPRGRTQRSARHRRWDRVQGWPCPAGVRGYAWAVGAAVALGGLGLAWGRQPRRGDAGRYEGAALRVGA